MQGKHAHCIAAGDPMRVQQAVKHPAPAHGSHKHGYYCNKSQHRSPRFLAPSCSPAQAAATIRALASMGWYSSGLWERAASGPLTRWDSDLLAAMSAQQIAGVAAAYAAVGHYSPALETRTAELLELSTSLHSGKSTSLVGNG
jgi:hypothetical protein